MYLRLFRPDVKQYTRRDAVRVLLQLGTNGVAVRARHRYRKSGSEKSVTDSQIQVTYIKYADRLA